MISLAALVLCSLILNKANVKSFIVSPSIPNTFERRLLRSPPQLNNLVELRVISNEDNNNSGGETKNKDEKDVASPLLLKPFLPATDPKYMCTGPVGESGDFVVSREGDPTLDELSDENIIKIVRIECSDLEVNTLVWKCLGYRFDADQNEWTCEKVFPKWQERYPTPPDFIGMQRVYEKEVDQPSLRSNQALVRSVPVEYKQSLKKFMKPLGWKGYQYAELTPNKTRRAQCANFLLYYREALFGKSLEQLLEEKRLKQQQEAEEKSSDNEWKPPVKEVF